MRKGDVRVNEGRETRRSEGKIEKQKFGKRGEVR